MSLADINTSFRLRRFPDEQLIPCIEPGQKSRMFKLVAFKADLDPRKISVHFIRIGAEHDSLDNGARIWADHGDGWMVQD